ncbi:MAG: aminoacyl-histidine dipeptidase [Agathobacter sp.]|nr:aminoacyl-histidine dipeptidase [Agathobacter sp.]
MSVLENLEPNKVFKYFEEIAAIPHGSRNTKQISDYLVAFAEAHNLEHYQDNLNNVVIIQEASNGYENAEPVIIQGHMDMVCEKENGCNIDFEKDGLDLYIDDDFIKAKGTTLGGDDGIAVAYALAILDSPEILHPRLEVVITVDEEIGMLGAIDIDLSMLKGHQMLNIDSDVEGSFLTSCAGGMSLNASIPVSRQSKKGTLINLQISGLLGGHSGGEIDKERANADILMGRLLEEIFANSPFGIVNLEGGLKDNAIPRECSCQIIAPDENTELITDVVSSVENTLKKEFSVSDPQLTVTTEIIGEAEKEILDFASLNKIIFYLRTIPNGVINMSQVIPGLVETSLNLGIMKLNDNSLDTVTSIRSSVSSRKEDLKNRIVNIVDILGGEVEIEGDYPAWEYKNESPLRDKIEQTYTKLFGTKPVFEAIHAGLECGILSDKIDNLDCVSFGPNNFDIHTPQERLSISSTKRIWDFLVEFLRNAR